ncbi:hypothetical protein ACH47B_37710 [Rhodococcus sp. NPDC019627]|uniref:hypothetical protein n=1 Tax=unclassified Rhodococcus (in: high G+C Gram-positive bacteria) TaxID=192944 RepID=UPI0033CF12B1
MPLTAEAEDFAEFARRWAPYGGASGEETFLRFGMNTSRFSERLWQVVGEGQLSNETAERFADAYPAPPEWRHGSPRDESVSAVPVVDNGSR